MRTVTTYIKSIVHILLILLFISILPGCKKESLKIAPSISILAITDIAAQSATASGKVSDDGGASVTARGICWSSTNPTPTIADNKIESGNGLGNFTSYLNGLTSGTTYTIRAFATNSIGTTYSNVLTFKTPEIEGEKIYPISQLDSLSEINKTTSWYTTNRSFSELLNLQKTRYNGFEKVSNRFIPFVPGTWSESKVINYYWNEVGMYLYTDLTGDGKKDLYAYYLKANWPTNARGLNFFSEYEKQSSVYDLQMGLTQVRKCVLADINNDNSNEIVLFSSGYDAMPFPGDSISIFYPGRREYRYLSKDIGYFHGGATGDINNDGLADIVAYSGGSAIIPAHPVAYINKGNGFFALSNLIFKGFNGMDVYYTVELLDINKDGKLDLFLGGNDVIIIPQENGEFNRKNAIKIIVESGLGIMDIAFFDFNKDEKLDLLTMNNKDSYNGYSLNLYLNVNNDYIDKTSDYFDQHTGSGKNNWIAWIRLFDYDKDGDIDIVGDGLYGDLNNHTIYWKNNAGKFIQVIQ